MGYNEVPRSFQADVLILGSILVDLSRPKESFWLAAAVRDQDCSARSAQAALRRAMLIAREYRLPFAAGWIRARLRN